MKTGKHGSIIQIIMSVLLTHNSSDFFGPFPLPANNLNKIRSDPNFGVLMTSLIESVVHFFLLWLWLKIFVEPCFPCSGVVGLTSQGIVRHCQSPTILCSPRGQPGILRLPPARPFQRLFYYRKGETSSEYCVISEYFTERVFLSLRSCLWHCTNLMVDGIRSLRKLVKD